MVTEAKRTKSNDKCLKNSEPFVNAREAVEKKIV